MKILTQLLVLLASLGTAAEAIAIQRKPGMIEDGDVWRVPTPHAALRALLEEENHYPVVAVLRQTFEARPAAELDALAEELRLLILGGTMEQSYDARLALMFAGSNDEDGIRYAKATDIFFRIFESFEDPTDPEAFSALYAVYETGGAEYVRAVFRSSKQPPRRCPGGQQVIRGVNEPPPEPPSEDLWYCPRSLWCNAGLILLNLSGDPDPEAPDRALGSRLCMWFIIL